MSNSQDNVTMSDIQDNANKRQHEEDSAEQQVKRPRLVSHEILSQCHHTRFRL